MEEKKQGQGSLLKYGLATGILSVLVLPLATHASFVELPDVSTIITSTTAFSSPLFLESSKFVYIGIGVTVAIAVAMLIMRSISRLVRGVTGSRRRGGRRRRR